MANLGPLFDEEWRKRMKDSETSAMLSDGVMLGGALTAGGGIGWLGGHAHAKKASLKNLVLRAAQADEFEKTAQATRLLMSVEKRAELFTDFVNQGFSIKEAADKVDSIELAFTKMGGTSMEVFKPVVNAAKDAGEAVGNAAGDIADKAKSAFSDARDKVVSSVKANPLKWAGGALGAGAVGGYAAHGSNKGAANGG